jgi:glycosidase
MKMKFVLAILGFFFVCLFFVFREVGLAQNFLQTPSCLGARKGDNNIWWSGLDHNSFEALYRRPFGAVKTDQGRVLLRFRTCFNDVSQVRLTVWHARERRRSWIALQPSELMQDQVLGPVQYWETALSVPTQPDILYYFFEIQDGAKKLYYIDDDIRSFPGGRGQIVETYNDLHSFQLTVYDKDMKVPEWTKGAIVYQIFPDRFRNGDLSNDPRDGQGWVYGQKYRKMPWNRPLCDPVGPECPDEKYNVFYGGDLKGIEDKLGYLKSLGVSVLYMNPIFESPTNHRYDITNFLKIDPILGNLEDFERLAQKAKSLGIRLLLDGVFNHVSADSPYFDLFGRWNSKFELSSAEGPGINDASGACESSQSPWRSWFYIPDIGSPAVFRDRRTLVYCPNPQLAGSQGPFGTYEAWFNFFNVPKINTGLQEVRDFFFSGGPDSVARYWTRKGLGAGWRLDVGGDIDAGWTNDPNNTYWEDFRRILKNDNPDTWIVGEEWGNASPWLLGREWDSVMNYRLRSALLNWMFDSCRGNGCWGRYFVDNDSNDNSHLGPIFPTIETQFRDQILGIQESYPEDVWKSALNLLGSHDTNRILFLLKKISNENLEVARRKLRFLVAFQMSYPGAPSIYYGDEVGVDASGSWQYNTWQDDPYNRVVYPWADQGLRSVDGLRQDFQALGRIRAESTTLQKGDFQLLEANNELRVFAFTRNLGSETYVAVFNRHHESQNLMISGLSAQTLATHFEEVFPVPGRRYRVQEGRLEMGSVDGLDLRILRSLGD